MDNGRHGKKRLTRHGQKDTMVTAGGSSGPESGRAARHDAVRSRLGAAEAKERTNGNKTTRRPLETKVGLPGERSRLQ